MAAIDKTSSITGSLTRPQLHCITPDLSESPFRTPDASLRLIQDPGGNPSIRSKRHLRQRCQRIQIVTGLPLIDIEELNKALLADLPTLNRPLRGNGFLPPRVDCEHAKYRYYTYDTVSGRHSPELLVSIPSSSLLHTSLLSLPRHCAAFSLHQSRTFRIDPSKACLSTVPPLWLAPSLSCSPLSPREWQPSSSIPLQTTI